MLINGIEVGADTVYVSATGSGANTLRTTGTRNVLNAVNDLTGSITVLLKLYDHDAAYPTGNAGGTFRLDDFILNGYVNDDGGSSGSGVQYANKGSYRYGFNGKENDNEVKGEGNEQDYGMRIYDGRLGRFLSIDPLFKEYPWYTPFQFSGNNPIQFIDRDGLEPEDPQSPKNDEAGQPPALKQGNVAHKLLTDYIRRIDPNETYWTANRQIAPGVPLRPDLVYGAGNSSVAGGVWELKPDIPSPSALLAGPQAWMYAQGMNLFNNTNKFSVGTTGGAPTPFIGELTLRDPNSGIKYNYRLDENVGGIYYSSNKSKNDPKPSPVHSPVTSPDPYSVPNLTPISPPLLTPIPLFPPGTVVPSLPRPSPSEYPKDNRRPNLKPNLLMMSIQALINCIIFEDISKSDYSDMRM